MLLYLDLDMYLELVGSRSSAVRQSTEAEITSNLVSVSANLPLKIGEAAVRAKNKGLNIAN